jgi:iron complex transport system substrate-binding protein
MAWDGGALPAWADAAEANRIPFVLMPNTSLAGLMQAVRLTGEVLGPPEARAAAAFIETFERNIRRVRARTDSLPASSRPKVLHTASAGVLAIDGRGTVIDDWIRIAGGVNAATVTGNARPVTLEQVVAWNPDVIIVGSAPNPKNRAQILADPRWQQIEAVKRGRVYANPSGAYLWDRHSAESALQVLWAAKMLHPDLFAEIDIERETREFYARFFHYRLTDRELESILTATPPPP